MTYGYVRVSSKDQNEARQVISMQEAAIEKNRIYVDKQSGKDFDRPAYRKLMKKLRRGDVLFIKSIDRLGRNYTEILDQWRIITREKQADIVVMDMPLLDTRKDHDLTGILITDIVLQLLSYVAETERQFIRQRQAEGIAVAKSQGIHMGRPQISIPPNFEQIVKAWEDKEISKKEALEICRMSETTFYRRRKKLQLVGIK